MQENPYGRLDTSLLYTQQANKIFKDMYKSLIRIRSQDIKRARVYTTQLKKQIKEIEETLKEFQAIAPKE